MKCNHFSFFLLSIKEVLQRFISFHNFNTLLLLLLLLTTTTTTLVVGGELSGQLGRSLQQVIRSFRLGDFTAAEVGAELRVLTFGRRRLAADLFDHLGRPLLGVECRRHRRLYRHNRHSINPQLG